MAKDTIQREDDKIAEKRPKQHAKLQHHILENEVDQSSDSFPKIRDSAYYRDNPEYATKGLERMPELIKEKLEEHKNIVDKYRLDHKEEVGSAISTPKIKDPKVKIGDITEEEDCPSGDCPDKKKWREVSGTPHNQEKSFMFYGDFDGTLYKSAYEWCLEDNQMFNSIEIISTLDIDSMNPEEDLYFGGIIGTNKQKHFDDYLWRNEEEFRRTGKIGGKNCHWDWVTTFKIDYGEELEKKFIKFDGWNSEWGCLVWHLRDNDLVETMPILLWGDTSVGHTFANAFQRTHALNDDPNKDAREDVQEYVESYTGQEPLIIINTDSHTDHPLLDYTNIEARHVFMDISCRDTPSPFLEAGKSNGNETIDSLGFLMYRVMTDWNNILWMKAYKHIDTKRCIAYLKELVEYNAK
ncbi:MAG: hypothetical protein CL489_05150 [Acidobacteria bacterium]|nr:hypothetical protein [Acidobacteriota bacterium]